MFATDTILCTIDSDILKKKKNIDADDEELDDRVIINAPFIRHTILRECYRRQPPPLRAAAAVVSHAHCYHKLHLLSAFRQPISHIFEENVRGFLNKIAFLPDSGCKQVAAAAAGGGLVLTFSTFFICIAPSQGAIHK